MHTYNGDFFNSKFSSFFVFCVFVKVKLPVSILCVCVRPRYDLYCVGWVVKPYSLTHSLPTHTGTHSKVSRTPYLASTFSRAWVIGVPIFIFHGQRLIGVRISVAQCSTMARQTAAYYVGTGLTYFSRFEHIVG